MSDKKTKELQKLVSNSKSINKKIFVEAHKSNNLDPYTKTWWMSLVNVYTYLYAITGNKLYANMLSFCNKKYKLKQ